MSCVYTICGWHYIPVCVIESVTKMLDIANVTAERLLLEFNTKKSVCIAFGPRIPQSLPLLLLGHKQIEWRDSISYHGVTFLSGKHIEIDCNIIKRKFYAACNCVFGNCYGISEVMQLQLQESYCLPILTYAAIQLPNAIRCSGKQEV